MVDLICHLIISVLIDFAISSASKVLPVPGSPFISNGFSKLIAALTASSKSGVAI